MAEDNTFLNADNLYEDVEGEAGKNLNLEEDQRMNLVGTILDRFYKAEDARKSDERRWLRSYENEPIIDKNSKRLYFLSKWFDEKNERKCLF